jgi:hypothetical protein
VSWLKKYTASIPPVNTVDFSLSHLWKLAKEFAAPPEIVAERLVEDLALWNCVLLRFTRESHDGDHAGRARQDPWHLTWHTKPSELNCYIPIGHREAGGMVFPRVTRRLASLIEELATGASQTGYLRRVLTAEQLRTSPTHGLAAFLHDSFPDGEVVVLAAAEAQTTVLDSLEGSGASRRHVHICFPAIPVR